jgi:hypothetical protein
MTFEADLFKHGSIIPTTVHFEALLLRFAPGNNWDEAHWEFSIAGSTIGVPACQLTELSTKCDRFEVKVVDGSGEVAGSFSVQTVMGGYPRHCYCFLFCADNEGMWSGHTVRKSFGQLVVVRHRFDPS